MKIKQGRDCKIGRPNSGVNPIQAFHITPRYCIALHVEVRWCCREFVISYISWDLITGVIRLITFRPDVISARALGKLL